VSTKALFWALEQKIPGGPKSVLIHLADWYNNSESAAWPTHEQLAEKSGWGRRTIQRHIEWLIEHGLVLKEKQMRGNFQVANRYRLPVGVLVIQGGQFGAAGVVNLAQQGGQSDAPSNTIKDTIKDTLNGADAQEADLKIQDVLSGDKMNRAEIFAKAKKDEHGNLTADGCGYVWRNSRRFAADTNGFQAELLIKDKKQLHSAYKRIGDDFSAVVWDVMGHWITFTKHAEKTAGAFNCPKKPNVGFFCKFIEAAADFAVPQAEVLGDEWKVQSTAKPLTKQTAPSKKVGKAITPEELAKINEELL